jgi:hypothetical protein
MAMSLIDRVKLAIGKRIIERLKSGRVTYGVEKVLGINETRISREFSKYVIINFGQRAESFQQPN